jgi:hypothetical protein
MGNFMGFLRFYRMAFKEALRRSLDIVQGIIFVLLVFGGVVVSRNPAAKSMIESFDLGGWKVAAIIFGGIVGTRLIVMPYWLWRAEHEARVKAEEALRPRLLLSLLPKRAIVANTARNEIKHCFLANVENSSAATLRSCQLRLGHHHISEPFDLRPGDSLDQPIIYLVDKVINNKFRTYVEVITFFKNGNRWDRSPSEWCPGPGDYVLKVLADSSPPAQVKVRLSYGDDWTLEVIQS